MISVAQFLGRHCRLGGLALLAALAISCRSPCPPPIERQVLEECPRSWAGVLPETWVLDPDSGQFALPGPTTSIPEFHDCQRFILAGTHGLSYMPIFAIFGASDLGARWDSLLHYVPASARASAPPIPVRSVAGPAAATASLPAVTTKAVRSSDVVNRAWSFVEIYAEGTYAGLGIGPGFSCAYLYFAGPGTLRAKMVTRVKEWDCRPSVNPDTLDGVVLEVKRSQPGGDTVYADYPPAARWEWDPANHMQYLGVKCGNGWCDVGPGDFEPAQDPVVASIDRVYHINGWFDRQRLASVPDANSSTAASATPAPAKPDSGWGIVFPDPALVKYRLDPDFKGKWKLSAQVALDPSLAAYERKLNLVPTARGAQRLNRIYLCWGSWAECRTAAAHDTAFAGVSGIAQRPQPQCAGVDNTGVLGTDLGKWWAAIISARGSLAFRCVIRCDHLREYQAIRMNGYLGTARWWWRTGDETIWMACDAGCCRIEPQ